MIVVHFESGLGNQMLDYAEFLAIQKAHPDEEIYAESILYEISDVQDKISMWNGYELENIFNIKIPNISELFSKEEWSQIVEEVKQSKFWEDGWGYSTVICEALNRHGLHLSNENIIRKNRKKNLVDKFSKTYIGYGVKRMFSHMFPQKMILKKANPESLFLRDKKNFYAGHKLLFFYKGNHIEEIEDRIYKSFTFPEIEQNTDNFKALNLIKANNAVALHIRRSDMLYANGYLYKYGYFKRAVKKIRKKINDPYFFVFGDTDSASWISDKPERIGLKQNDKVMYINWNKENESFRDMQLMTYCKGVIITNSSFGWWGAFLNRNTDKITISPFINYNTTDWV